MEFKEFKATIKDQAILCPFCGREMYIKSVVCSDIRKITNYVECVCINNLNNHFIIGDFLTESEIELY